MMHAMRDDVITAGAAAEILGVSRESVRRYADAGLLPHHRTPGGTRRFRRSDVEALAAERTEGATA